MPLAGVADTTPEGGGCPPVPACAAGTLSVTSPVAAAAAMMYLRTRPPLTARRIRAPSSARHVLALALSVTV